MLVYEVLWRFGPFWQNYFIHALFRYLQATQVKTYQKEKENQEKMWSAGVTKPI